MVDKRIFLFLLVLVALVAGQSVLVDNGDITVSQSFVNCTLSSNEEKTCESCLRKGNDCFWCGGRVKRCMTYEWYFPDCDLDDVKHKQCWVNWTALIVVVSVICGIVLVILVTLLCCCFCKCKECGRQRRKRAMARREVKEQTKRDDLSMRQMERSAKRNEEMQYYRDKYGIPSANGSPLPEKKPLP